MGFRETRVQHLLGPDSIVVGINYPRASRLLGVARRRKKLRQSHTSRLAESGGRVARGAADLSPLSGKPVRFRFHLRNGALHAFWVSPDAIGASHGYVATGGPGFTAPTDTVGAGTARQP